MIVGTELSSYADESHGSYGVFICSGVGGAALFLPAFFYNLSLLIKSTPVFTEDYLMTWFFLFLSLSGLGWFGSSILYAIPTIQFIKFKENEVFVRLYFFRKFTFEKSELLKIEDFKINKLMSQTRTYPAEGTGFYIYLKNGKKYRVSPNMKGFSELKKLLMDSVEERQAVKL